MSSDQSISVIQSCRTPSDRINRELQGGEDPYDALSSRSFSTKKLLIIGLFCGCFFMDKASYDSTPLCNCRIFCSCPMCSNYLMPSNYSDVIRLFNLSYSILSHHFNFLKSQVYGNVNKYRADSCEFCSLSK